MKFFHALIATAMLGVCAFGQNAASGVHRYGIVANTTAPATPETTAAVPVFNTGQAARLVIGQKDFTVGDFGATNQLLGTPSGIALVNGTLWIVDANRLGGTPNNNRVLRYTDINTFPTPTQDTQIQGSLCGVCVGTAGLVLGQPDFFSSNYALTPNGLRNPSAVATDGTILVVADTDNNRVLIWKSLPAFNGQPADVVIGQKDFVHGGTASPPNATSLRGPEGVWLADGKLYVADTQDNRILIYNHVPTTNGASADVVAGQPSFTSFVQPDLTQGQATPAANNMQDPVSVTTDGQRMYVTDLGQNRVLIFNTIPTANGASADVVIGQPDMVSAISNNSFAITNSTLDADGVPEGQASVLCQSNAAYAYNQGQTGTSVTDSAGTVLYPTLCAATLSLPRYALSDGTRLFIADGGNDRVLIYNTIPTTNGVRADAILGEPDEFSDNTGDNPNGASAFQTPISLAWDSVNQNLYVSDTYNRRIVVYTPGVLNIPLNGIVNAASLTIYALGSVQIGGSIVAKDTVTITINGTPYTYTVQATDTVTTVVDNIVALINKAADPNVVASADDTTSFVVLTARQGGTNGGNIAYTATTSANASISAVAGGSNLSIYLENPGIIAPGTVINLYGQNLCDTTATADTTQAYLPFSLSGCALYMDGNRVPLFYVSPTQVNAQLPWEFADRTSTSVVLRTTHADGSVSVTAPVAVTVSGANPGIFAAYGSDPRQGFLYHASSAAADLIEVAGTVNPGDIATITIGTATYTYTVQAGDTSTTLPSNIINEINSAPDPIVYATVTNEFSQILLTSLVPGPGGEGAAVTVSVAGPTAPVPSGSTPTAGLVLTAVNATMCCSNVAGAPVTTANPAAPGEMLYLLATGLGPTTPSDQASGQVFTGQSANPPLTPVDTIVVGADSGQAVNVALVPGLVGIYYVEFEVPLGLGTDLQTQMHISQGAAISNIVTFPLVAP